VVFETAWLVTIDRVGGGWPNLELEHRLRIVQRTSSLRPSGEGAGIQARLRRPDHRCTEHPEAASVGQVAVLHVDNRIILHFCPSIRLPSDAEFGYFAFLVGSFLAGVSVLVDDSPSGLDSAAGLDVSSGLLVVLPDFA